MSMVTISVYSLCTASCRAVLEVWKEKNLQVSLHEADEGGTSTYYVT